MQEDQNFSAGHVGPNFLPCHELQPIPGTYLGFEARINLELTKLYSLIRINVPMQGPSQMEIDYFVEK